jgi:iron complex transport system substrate-binding protein
MVSSGKIRYPHYSYEELIAASPDVIIDLSVGNESSDIVCAEVVNHWKKFSTIPAVKNNRIYCLDNGTFLIPSPRAVGSVGQLAKLIHPEVYSSNEK